MFSQSNMYQTNWGFLTQVLPAVYRMKYCLYKMCLHKEYRPIMKKIYSGMLMRMISHLALILDRHPILTEDPEFPLDGDEAALIPWS